MSPFENPLLRQQQHAPSLDSLGKSAAAFRSSPDSTAFKQSQESISYEPYRDSRAFELSLGSAREIEPSQEGTVAGDEGIRQLTTTAPPREAPSCAATVGIWSMNVIGSVGIIMVNKQVMSGYDFVFVSTLTGMHFAVTALTGVASACAGLVPSKLSVPFGVLLGFALLGNASLVATNLSLLLNSVGFYQISKVSIIPTVFFLEATFKGRSFSPRVKAAVAVVMLGVALCTVSEIHVNPLGLAVAAFAVLCSAMHMMLIGLLQEQYSIGPFDLLSQSAPLQAFMLLLVGPSLDLWLTSRSLLEYHYQPYSILFIVLSCCLAVVCNLSAYLCIGTFSASTYQVLGHMKTVLVLVLGVVLFDNHISLKGFLGMGIAVTGMVMYSHATAAQAVTGNSSGGAAGTSMVEAGGGGKGGVGGGAEGGWEKGGKGGGMGRGEASEREEIPLLRIVVDAEGEEGEEQEEGEEKNQEKWGDARNRKVLEQTEEANGDNHKDSKRSPAAAPMGLVVLPHAGAFQNSRQRNAGRQDAEAHEPRCHEPAQGVEQQGSQPEGSRQHESQQGGSRPQEPEAAQLWNMPALMVATAVSRESSSFSQGSVISESSSLSEESSLLDGSVLCGGGSGRFDTEGESGLASEATHD